MSEPTYSEYKLSLRQWQFAEEYLINGYKAEPAYQKVYGGGINSKTHGGATILKSKKVQKFIADRLDNKFKAAQINYDWLFTELQKNAAHEDKRIANEALKIIQQAMAKQEELKARVEEAEKPNEISLSINYATHEPDEQDI